MRRDGEMFEFGHLSFQEYLAAEALLGDPKGKSRDEVAEAYLAGDEWWRDVLPFYMDLSGNPAELRRWVERFRKLGREQDRINYLVKAISDSYAEPKVVTTTGGAGVGIGA